MEGFEGKSLGLGFRLQGLGYEVLPESLNLVS